MNADGMEHTAAAISEGRHCLCILADFVDEEILLGTQTSQLDAKLLRWRAVKRFCRSFTRLGVFFCAFWLLGGVEGLGPRV